MAENESPETVVELLEDGPCKKRLKAEIPIERVEKEIADSYKQLSGSVQLPGFRRGKIPRSVLERRYGKKIIEDVRDDMMQTTFQEQLEKHSLRLVGAPKFEDVDFKMGEPFCYEATFEVVPTFELAEYKGLEVKAEPVEVSDEEVTSELEQLREQTVTFEELEFGSQQDDDFASCDIAIFKDGEEHIARQGVILKVGSDSVDNIIVEGLGVQLKEATESVEICNEAVVPSDFPDEGLRGETVELRVSLKSLKRRVLPELTDEIAANFGADSVDDLKKEIRENLEKRSTAKEERRQEEELVNQLVDSTDMDLPENVLEQRQRELELDHRYRLSHEGKSEDEVEEMLKGDTSAADSARRELKSIFVLEKIGEQEQVFVTEEDVSRRLQEIAMVYRRDPMEVLEEYRKRERLPELRSELMREKVRQFLRKKANVV